MTTQTKEIVPIEQGQLVGIPDPNGVLDAAINAAKALTRVVSQKKKPVIMNGEQYLEYEDWQTLGQFYTVTTKTGESVPVEIDGVKGAKAVAVLVNFRTGEIVGGAEAYCMRDEEKWNTRPKYEWQEQADGEKKKVKVGDEPVPWFQLASMAQTRAGAKALRNRLAWIAVLAGYKPTPAEEITEDMKSGGSSFNKVEHWCKVHNTTFFKKGKMKNWAHPIGDTGEWCNEESAKPEEKQEHPAEIEGIDADWLKESLTTLKWNPLQWIADNMQITGAKIVEVVSKMDQLQKDRFVAEIQSRLDMK